MLRKVLVGALAAVGTAIAVTAIAINRENEEDTEVKDDENEINFINILDESNEDETENETEVTKFSNEEDESSSPEVKEIKKIYPYLSNEFIQDVFHRNDELNDEFPEDTLIEITHQSIFATDEARDAFIEAEKLQGYRCEIGENGNVRSIRKMFTENGSIISEIYNVANQTALLDGDYLGQLIKK